VVAVAAVAQAAADRARAGEGPTLIEANTYRQVGHSRSDPATYRPEGELEMWLARDPITLLEAAMTDASSDARPVIAAIHDSANHDVFDARDRALSWPAPNVEDRLKDVYA
jgi:acetoin:2,6-dichlorophenolindophenol oxidoreductase subunit alpha